MRHRSDAESGSTVIQSPATLTPYAFFQTTPLGAIVRVSDGAHARISGLTVTGPIPCGLVAGVATVQAATLDLSDAQVLDITNGAACPQPRSGRSVRFGHPPSVTVDGVRGSNGFGRVSNVAIDNYQDAALDAVAPLNLAPTTVTFDSNVITSGNPQVPIVQSGINVSRGAKARVTGNTVIGAVCTADICGDDPIIEFQSAGILVSTNLAGTTVSDNFVTDTDIGVYHLFAPPNCCTISSNTLPDNRFFGIAIQDGDGSTRSNTITGGQVGIGVIADAVDVTAVLRGDRISGTSVAPIREIDCCGFTATAIVKN